MTPPDMPLTQHFSWTEVMRSETAMRLKIYNGVPIDLMLNVQRTARLMETVRAELGGPLKVNSWYRCPVLNAAVGGAKTSYHMKALAVDFKPTTVSLKAAFEILARSTIPFDQLIQEGTKDGAAWIHIGFAEEGHYARHDIMRAVGDKLGGKMHFTRVAAG